MSLVIKLTISQLKSLLSEQKEIVATEIYKKIKSESNDKTIVKPFSSAEAVEIDESLIRNIASNSRYPKDVTILDKYL